MKIPKTYRGKDVEQGYEDYLKKQEQQPIPQPTLITPANINNPQNYIILPSNIYCPKDLLIAKHLSHLNKTWEQCQEALQKDNHFMLPLRQFIDFLTLLQTNNVYDGSGSKLSRQECKNIFNDITEVRNHYHAELLDAQYSKQGKDLMISYAKVQPDGSLLRTKEPLEACLMTNKTPGISLEDWLNNPTSQGLPRENVPKGSLYYWHPIEGRVSGFGAGSGGVVLGCDVVPRVSDAVLGTRAARVKT